MTTMVMMWAMKHDVLPADTHVARVFERLGYIESGQRPEAA